MTIKFPFRLRLWRGAALACAGALCCLAVGAAHAAPMWTSSWGAALMEAGEKQAIPASEYRQVTLRQTMRLSLGGAAVRVRISNLFGREPLVIGGATLGHSAAPGSSELAAGSPLALRFHGARRIVIGPGMDAYSDPAEHAVSRGNDISISLYVESGPAQQSVHTAAFATQFLASGDQTHSAVLEGAQAKSSWFHIDAIEVLPARVASVVVAGGDSITDGAGSGKDRNERWTDYLVRRLPQGARDTAVINAGIGGNRMLLDGIGPRLLARFERDVLQRPGVTHAIVLIGVNDLGSLHKRGMETPEARTVMLAELQAGWRRMVEQAHAQGVCVLAGTITPYAGSTTYKPAPFNDADRQVINDWLRGAALMDGVADFDLAVRDPNAIDRLQPSFDSGDHLHLSPAGYSAMADAVPLERLTYCRWTHAVVPAN